MADEVGQERMMGFVPAIEAIASIAHDANRRYCMVLGEKQPLWNDAPVWQRESAREGVVAIMRDPSMTPEQSHESWLAHKAAEGWSWGPVKDPRLQLHPCFLPYAELPEEQQVKDALFQAIVRALLP